MPVITLIKKQNSDLQKLDIRKKSTIFEIEPPNFCCKLSIPKNPSIPNLEVKFSRLLKKTFLFVLGGPLFICHPVNRMDFYLSAKLIPPQSRWKEVFVVLGLVNTPKESNLAADARGSQNLQFWFLSCTGFFWKNVVYI